MRDLDEAPGVILDVHRRRGEIKLLEDLRQLLNRTRLRGLTIGLYRIILGAEPRGLRPEQAVFSHAPPMYVIAT